MKAFCVLVLLLVPIQVFQNSGVLCDHAPSLDPRKKEEIQWSDMKSNSLKNQSEINQPNVKPEPAKVRYDTSNEEKCDKKAKSNEEEICRREIEIVKASVSKCPLVTDNKASVVKPPVEKIVKIDFEENEIKSCGSSFSSMPAKPERIVCAECEQCELQVKASGDGVYLKCKDCQEVPQNEMIFPAGNNRKIIVLP